MVTLYTLFHNAAVPKAHMDPRAVKCFPIEQLVGGINLTHRLDHIQFDVSIVAHKDITLVDHPSIHIPGALCLPPWKLAS